jgi:ADP-heptose:LPS heptosyltransferase
MAKILVIKFHPLKLFIQCVPAFAAIRKHHPNDEITILTERSLAKFCKKTNYFNKVWIDKKPIYLNPMGVYEIISIIKNGKFDLVYDLQNDERAEWYFRLIGMRKPKWNSSYVRWCSHFNKPNTNISYQQNILNQLKLIGIKAMPAVNLSTFSNNEADELPARYAMICPSGNKENLGHKWNLTNYAEVIKYLHEKHNITSVLVGDNINDIHRNRMLASFCPSANPINFSGKTSVNGIIAVASKALFCLGNETAPTHIAAFSGTKTIMLCSRFSPPSFIAPQVNNLAVIEEPMLENLEISRVIDAIEAFGVAKSANNKFKAL